tara:strand:- start:2587 stop:3372 length:786 start_codon:yes stop_codon:yes gene_type:complete
MSFKISDNLIGFDKELSFFLKLYKQKKMPNTILFQGLQGIGKYTFVLHLINSITKDANNDTNLEYRLTNDQDVLILKKNENNSEFKFEEIKKIIDFCKYKSLNTKSKFIIIKSTNFLNKSSVNALLKLTEEVKENVYFLFTSDFLSNNSKTLESRFFIKKLFLKKKFYNQILLNFFNENNIDTSRIEENLHYTPGDSIRKYFFNLDGNLEHLKKNNVELFYKIISEKIINKFKNEHLEILRKTKVNLIFKNDISRIIEKLS